MACKFKYQNLIKVPQEKTVKKTVIANQTDGEIQIIQQMEDTK